MRFAALFPPMLLALSSCGNGGSKLPDNIDYHTHIKPILLKNCVPCHQPGGAAPFSLDNFERVRNKAKTIVKVTESGYMPPWPADPAWSHFLGEKVLSREEKEILRRWFESGAQEGIPGPDNSNATTAIIRKAPDLVVPLEAISLKGDRQDRFFLIKAPGIMEQDTWVRAVEFAPGIPALVHHFNGHILNYDGRRKDHRSGSKAREVQMGAYGEHFPLLKLENDDGSYPERVHSAVNYLPGMQGQFLPEGIGTFRLSKAFSVVGNDLHYGPAEKDTTDRSSIRIWFGSKPPERPVYELMLGTNGVVKPQPPLVIPAGKKTVHYCRFKVNQDISLVSVNPHMHLLGSSIRAWAEKPNGDTVKIIRIPQWNFRWQFVYTFPTFVRIPAGSEIVVEAHFDNTETNPDNPFKPPVDVAERLEYGGASMRATDEMLQFIIQWTPYRKGDENIRLGGKP
ncbi:MAG: c-type cytochrome [Bacteroidia bacterium]